MNFWLRGVVKNLMSVIIRYLEGVDYFILDFGFRVVQQVVQLVAPLIAQQVKPVAQEVVLQLQVIQVQGFEVLLNLVILLSFTPLEVIHLLPNFIILALQVVLQTSL